MAILGQCKIADSVSGQQQLVDLVAEQCNFTQVFNPADQEHLDRIIICIKHALPYFSVYFLYSTPRTSVLIKTNRKIILDSGEIDRICFLHL
jgi:hypothetical protein